MKKWQVFFLIISIILIAVTRGAIVPIIVLLYFAYFCLYMYNKQSKKLKDTSYKITKNTD